jgi:hypothetical protein
MLGILHPFMEGAEHLGMGFHGSGVLGLYCPLMLFLQLQIFGKYVLCVFSFVRFSPQNFHISSYVAHSVFHSSKLVTQVVHFVTDYFQPSEVLY